MFFRQKGPVLESMAPGKDQRPTGAKLLAQIVKENWGELFLLNFCYVACLSVFLLLGFFLLSAGSLPLALVVFFLSFFIAGPATIAFSKAFVDWQCARGYEPVRVFWHTFKSNFKKGVVAGLVYHSLMTITAFAAGFYLTTGEGSMPFMVLGILAAIGFLVTMISSFYGYMMLAGVDLPTKSIIKNSFYLFFLDLKDDLAMLTTVLLTSLPVVLFIPYSFAILLLLYFSVLWLFVSHFAWRGILKFVVPKEEPEGSTEEV